MILDDDRIMTLTGMMTLDDDRNDDPDDRNDDPDDRNDDPNDDLLKNVDRNDDQIMTYIMTEIMTKIDNFRLSLFMQFI